MEVGDLAVVLDARTKEFRAALDQAEKRITKFEKAAEDGTERAARGFGKLGGKIGGLKSAVTGLVAAFGLWKALQLGKEAVGLEAEYESIGIQLETLTGSAENAAAVMKNVNRVVLETPYSLEEMGRTAGYSALVFRDNTDAVNEFTGHIADLAAAFKRPIELIGQNLPRAFSAGLGAADAFREAGISEEILRISGRTKVADVTTQDLVDAIRKMTSEGGIAYKAAARQADSLAGVLSNTGIAADNLKRAFGEAVAPAVIQTGKEVLQPFFEDLKERVDANRDAISDWALQVGPALVSVGEGFVFIAQSAAKAWSWMSDVMDLEPHGVVQMRDRAGELRDEIEALTSKIEIYGEKTGRVIKMRVADWRHELAAKESDLALLEAQINVLDERRRARHRAEPEVEKPTLPGGYAQIDIERLPGAGRGKDTLRELRGMADLSEVFSSNTASSLAILQATGSTAGGIAWALRDAANEAAKIGPLTGIGGEVGADIREGVHLGLVEGIKAGRFDAAETFGGISDSISTRFLDRGVGEMTKGLEEGFGDLFDDLGPKLSDVFGGIDLGPLSGAVQGAFAAAAGIGIQLITRAIGGGSSRQTFAQIQGAATTDVRELRGVSVGPTSIGIAEVARGIDEAITPLTAIMREHLRVTRGILSAVSGGYGIGAGSSLETEAAALLAGSSPALA